MFKKMTAALLGLLIVGCAKVNIIPITSESGKLLNSREVVATKREKPDFAAMTAGKAVFGMLGGAAMISAGNEIIKNNSVEDPADYIAEKIKTILSRKFGTKKSSASINASSSDVAQICAGSPTSDLIIDVRTINWSFMYFPTAWGKYRVIYSASIRLIDNKTKRVIAEGFSSRVPEETPDAPSKEELLANNGERLKLELKKGAEHCINDFKTKILLLL